MASDDLEQLRHRLDSLESLGGIVRTMKALAAANIRQFEAASYSLRDYERSVQLGLGHVSRTLSVLELAADANADGRAGPAALSPSSSGNISDTTSGAIIFGTDHGLCGRFNETLVTYANTQLAQSTNDPQLLVIGARAASLLTGAYDASPSILPLPASLHGVTETVQTILQHIDRWRSRSSVHKVMIFHQHATDDNRTKPICVNLLPVEPQQFGDQHPWPDNRRPMHSLPATRLLGHLLRQYFFVSLYRACVESQYCEHATRLRTMQAAQKNIDEALQDMQRHYRQARQSRITSELLEVVAGYDATGSKPED